MKKLLALLRVEKAAIRHHHYFYFGFFLLYFLAIFFLLYYVNGLTLFKVNAHYFSNVIGSLCKRAISDMAPYALIFYLLFHQA